MRYIILILLSLTIVSCNWFKNKAKDTVNKTGEVVGKAGSEFTDGVAKGIEKTFQNDVSVSEDLQKKGLNAGKIIISSTDSTSDNILTAYLIFTENFDQKVSIKVFNENGQEYGRRSQMIQGNKDEAKYIDFIFDRRTNIDGRGKLKFE